MNKQNGTYQTPGGALTGAAEVPGALWYGVVCRHGWHEVAVIRIDPDDGMLLCSGPTFFGWARPDEVVRDADTGPALEQEAP